MLLADLHELFSVLVKENRLPPPGFKRRPVRFVVELDSEGALVGVTDTGTERYELLVPEIGRSGSNPAALPIIDNGKFVLGIPKFVGARNETSAERAHTNYIDRLVQLRAGIEGAPGVADAIDAVMTFVKDADGARHAIEAKLGCAFEPNTKGEFVASNALFRFRVNGSDPTEHPSVRAWWALQVEGNLGSGASAVCQVTGAQAEIARITPRVSLRQGKEALVSANFPAAERYHASQSSGARIGVDAAIRTHQALNWLITSPDHHRRIGEATFLWWVPSDLDFDPFANVVEPDPAVVASQLGSVWAGRPGVSPDAAFRLLVLSLTEARVVLRSDHYVALGELDQRLRRWFQLIESTGKGGRCWYPSLSNLAGAAVGPGEGAARRAQRDRLVTGLAEAAITGAELPALVLAAAVARCRVGTRGADRRRVHVNSDRAALLRLCRHLKEETMTEAESAGALCGRLLAQLESAQYAALGETNRTIVDRYYAAASSTPERVFPKLLSGAQAHLSKAGRQRPGAKVGISQRLGELSRELAAAGGIPPTLTTAGQADFALGYWQERQARFDRKNDETKGDTR